MNSPLKTGTEAFLRADGFVYLVEILGTAQNAIWTTFPDIAPPTPGTGVELDIDHGDTFIRYHAHVAVSAPNSPGIMLERAETATHPKQRREYRVPYDADIDLYHLSSEEFSSARIIDVSGGGVRIASNGLFAVGDHLVLTVQWPNDLEFEYPVRILYARPPKLLRHTYGYGVRFGAIEPEPKRALVEFLSREIARRYPEELQALYPRTRRATKPGD
jgi:hypothetical protein